MMLKPLRLGIPALLVAMISLPLSTQVAKTIAGKPPANNATREITLEKRYLNLPVKNGGPKRQMSLLVDGQPARSFEIELADAEPDWWAFIDVAPFKGKTATLKVDNLPEDAAGLNAIDQSDEIKNSETLYREKIRPQFHFSPRRDGQL